MVFTDSTHVCNIEQLDKWEAPPLNQVSKELEKVRKLIKQQQDASNEFRLATCCVNI